MTLRKSRVETKTVGPFTGEENFGPRDVKRTVVMIIFLELLEKLLFLNCLMMELLASL